MYAELLCCLGFFFLKIILVEAFDTVKMGCNMFYLSLMINTASF